MANPEESLKGFVPKTLNMEPENNLDVDKALKQVQENDPQLTSLNMNNIKNIPIPTLISLSEALHKNTHLKTLSMASTRLNDRIAKVSYYTTVYFIVINHSFLE
ncbi:tropomodulin-2-like [Anneissia japonica]|uniref:tropomodulin-2-like n=1 Tax=Anneissia japonica TaxID=1529436 RepID=UPI001425B686|nr:tropomodulin-2-like [Anneissia japonica]